MPNREFTERDQTNLALAIQQTQDLGQRRDPAARQPFDLTNPDTRIFVAAFDGTGNEADVDLARGKTSNVARIRNDIQGLHDSQVSVGYQVGPGTQAGTFASLGDKMSGGTGPERVSAMYDQFRDQSHRWLSENPNAQIAVITTGFSRGAVEASLFANTVDQHGIRNQDPTQPNLVAPQGVRQAALLFDPVATGDMERFKRSLPDSVVTGLQLSSMDETRSLFPVDNILPKNNSTNFSHIHVPGGHSDVGGAVKPDQGRGIGDITGNIAADFVNDLTQRQVLRSLPTGEMKLQVNTVDSTGQSMAGFVTGRGYRADRLDGGQVDALEGAVVAPADARRPVHVAPEEAGAAYPGLNPPSVRDDLKALDPYAMPHVTPQNAHLLEDATRRAKEVLANPEGFRAVNDTLGRMGDLGQELLANKPEVVNRLAADLTASAVVNKLERIDAAYLHPTGDGHTLLVGYQQHQHPELVKSAFADIEGALRTPAQANLDRIAPPAAPGVPDPDRVLQPLEHGPPSHLAR